MLNRSNRYSVKYIINVIFIALFATIAAIICLNLIQSQDRAEYTKNLTENLLPSSRYSSQIRTGLADGISTLRDYALINDKTLKDLRKEVWERDVQQPFAKLLSLSSGWENDESRKHIDELSSLIDELKESQLEIEEILHTEGNIPALSLLENSLAPLSLSITENLTAIIDIEVGEYSSRARKELLALMAALRADANITVSVMHGYVQTGSQKYLDTYMEISSRQRDHFSRMGDSYYLLSMDQSILFEAVEEAHEDYFKVSQTLIAERGKENWNKALYLLKTEAIPQGDRLKSLLDKISSLNQQSLDSSRKLHDDKDMMFQVAEFSLFSVFVIVALFSSNFLQRIIVAPLTRLAGEAKRFGSEFSGNKFYASGQGEIVDDVENEIALLSGSFESMKDEIRVQVRVIGSNHDDLERQVEERTLLNDELRKKKEEAEQASYSKSRFLATMSHELRTPMNGVVGMAELLKKTDLNPKQNTYAGVITSSADMLLTIIDDILDFSRIESGELKIERISVDLYYHVKEIVDLMMTRAEEKKIELVLDMQESIRGNYILDPVRVKQIVLNLLGNAIKFTENGSVVLHVTEVAKADGRSCLRFEVEDDGIGIALDKQDAIFDHFTQADVSTTRNYGGTGLGLAICKKLVVLMEGSIGVDSELGKGSLFWFEVSAIASEVSTHAPRSEVKNWPQEYWNELKSQNVLIVDDVSSNLQVLGAHLTSWDIKSTLVTSGEEALMELESREAGGDGYTMAIVDYMMPEMNGESLINRIRSQAKFKDLKFIMITAAYKLEDPGRVDDMGLDACLMKPIYASTLLDTISNVIGSRYVSEFADAALEEQPSPVAHSMKRILLVEDSPVNSMCAKEILNSLGYSVDLAEDGSIACEKYKAMSYDLILMDCMMPVMDGYEATRAIREIESQDGGSLHIPIVAMTANALGGDKEQCLNSGMDDYLSKPAKIEAMKCMVEKHILKAA